MSLLSRAPAPRDLVELWRADVRGQVAHRCLSDVATGSVFVSDGWNVAYASLAVHRLDLATGRALASTRTRHQPVGAMVMADGVLWVVTRKRLLGLDPGDLSVRVTWDEGLVQDAHQVVVTGRHAVLANWLRPTLAVVDLDDGTAHRVRAGGQPTLVSTPSGPVVLSALDGGERTVDLVRNRLGARRDAPAVTAAACLDGVVWGATGGRVQTRSGVTTSGPGRHLTRLDDAAVRADVGGLVRDVVADAARGTVWATVGDDRASLVEVDPRTTAVVRSFRAPGGHPVVHVDPQAGVALALAPGEVASGGETLVALRLPD